MSVTRDVSVLCNLSSLMQPQKGPIRGTLILRNSFFLITLNNKKLQSIQLFIGL